MAIATRFRAVLLLGSSTANAAVNSYTSFAQITKDDSAPSTVGVVHLNSEQVVASVVTGNHPLGMAVDLFSNIIFAANTGDHTGAVIERKTNKKIVSVSANSRAIDLNPVTRLAYASDPADSLAHVISE